MRAIGDQQAIVSNNWLWKFEQLQGDGVPGSVEKSVGEQWNFNLGDE
jgi:hypothetical protein